MKHSTYIVIAAINMFIAVGAGAFGAHGLKAVLSAEMLAVWQTAVHYHMVHALGLLGVGVLMTQWNDAPLLHRAALFMLTGIVIFLRQLVRPRSHRYHLAGGHHPLRRRRVFARVGNTGVVCLPTPVAADLM